MLKLNIKNNINTFRDIFSRGDGTSVEKVNLINKSLLIFTFVFIISMLFKIYVSNLVVIEAKNVDSLKYRLKITESELKKIKKELAKYNEKDVLLDYSNNFQDKEKIEVVVVKE